MSLDQYRRRERETDTTTRDLHREARAAIRLAIRQVHPCTSSRHTKAGHADASCWVCGGIMVSKKGQDHIEKIEALLDEALTGEEVGDG